MSPLEEMGEGSGGHQGLAPLELGLPVLGRVQVSLS